MCHHTLSEQLPRQGLEWRKTRGRRELFQHRRCEDSLQNLWEFFGVKADEGFAGGQAFADLVRLVSEAANENHVGVHVLVPVQDLADGLGADAIAVEIGVGKDDDEAVVVVVHNQTSLVDCQNAEITLQRISMNDLVP